MVVLDSSFLIAYHNARDRHHAAAARAMVQLLAGAWGPAVLLEYVFLEVVTVLATRRGMATAVTVGRTLLTAREVRFLPCSELFLEAWEAFQHQAGAAGGLSFVDAAIVAAAREHASGRVLTFDRDFDGVTGLHVLPG